MFYFLLENATQGVPISFLLPGTSKIEHELQIEIELSNPRLKNGPQRAETAARRAGGGIAADPSLKETRTGAEKRERDKRSRDGKGGLRTRAPRGSSLDDVRIRRGEGVTKEQVERV